MNKFQTYPVISGLPSTSWPISYKIYHANLICCDISERDNRMYRIILLEFGGEMNFKNHRNHWNWILRRAQKKQFHEWLSQNLIDSRGKKCVFECNHTDFSTVGFHCISLDKKEKKRFFFHHFKPFRIRLYGQNMFNCLKYQHCCALAHVAFWHSKLALTRLKCQQMRNYNAQKPNEKATNETYRNSIVEKYYSTETTVRERWR